ncbi:tRNA pseudouridine(38-40) synthase TruA [Bacillus fonticola]|uniref:tRNA pseudouridine(38-40) synthase TruA n=1 Tax=Bacillus fonticola TaxID=2728853 RepID=UPI0014735675|nr:tRNA pseudouridine(38-40) synthase TruA [Bacillus fonticola]
MVRVKCVIAYEGTMFHGYQIQPSGRTVQGELERILTAMHKGEAVHVTASGRTDAKVHAVGQVLHFDTPYSLTATSWKKALNAQLPADIFVKNVALVSPQFHARFGVKTKEYRYRVLCTPERDPFRRHVTSHYPYPLDDDSMDAALKALIGTHDFSSFCASNTDVVDKVRTLSEAKLWRDGDELVFQFVGSGFLYNMVRILVGTLLEVGNGHRSPQSLPELLCKKDRTAAGKTAPPEGLFLWEVTYHNEEGTG